MTLHDVDRLSRGVFKPSTIAGYERGERMISLDRFRALAEVYRLPPDRLLGEVIDRVNPDRAQRLVVDLNRLSLLGDPERDVVAEYVHGIRARRGSFLESLIPLRAGDLDAIALASRLNPRALLGRIRPALAQPDPAKTL